MVADRLYLLLDTNILLHYPPPDQIDWPKLCDAEEVAIVIYPLLRTEISNAKDMHKLKHLRQRAGQRETWIREKLAKPGQPICPGVVVIRDAKEPLDLLRELGLDRQVSDDMIVATAERYRREGKAVCVASGDGGLEMKLEDLGVKVVVPDDDLRLVPEPDPEKKRADEAEHALRQIKSRLPTLIVKTAAPCVIARQAEYGDVDAYVEEQLNDVDRVFKLYQAQGDIRHVFIATDSIRLPRHEQELAFAKEYLRNRHRWMSITDGAQEVRIALANEGMRSATNVRLRLKIPHSLIPYGAGGFGTLPMKNRIFSMVFAGLPTEAVRPELDTTFRNSFDGINNGPIVDRESNVVTFNWGRIDHDAEVRADPIWLTAKGDAPLGTTALQAEVLCEEISGKQTSHIPVEVIAAE